MQITPIDTRVQIDLTGLPGDGPHRRLAGALDALAVLQRQAERVHGGQHRENHADNLCSLCVAVTRRAARVLMR